MKLFIVLLFILAISVTGCHSTNQSKVDGKDCADIISEEYSRGIDSTDTESFIDYEVTETTTYSDPETSYIMQNTTEQAENALTPKRLIPIEQSEPLVQEDPISSTVSQTELQENPNNRVHGESSSNETKKNSDFAETNAITIIPEATAPVTETEPSIDINTYINYAINSGKKHGLIYDSSTTACWDNPIIVGTNDSAVKRDIDNLFDWYQIQEFTMFSVWIEERSDGKHDLFIGYA